MSFLNELKRRNVLRVAAAYVVAAWLLIQVAETIFPLFGFDDTPARIVVIVLAIGFIPSMVFAWVFELTPEGLKKEKDIDRTLSVSKTIGKKLDRLIMIVLALALGYFAFDKFVISESREAAITESARQEGRSEALVESYGDKSIAVLPFVDMSSNKDQEYMSDGIAEELLNLLAKIPELRVISRSSAFSYKGKDIKLVQLASELNVAHILEGSVRKSGNRIRVAVQLIEARSDTHLWSQTYDRNLDDIFAIQDEIAAAVTESLRVALFGNPQKSVTHNTESFELTLQGRYFYNRGNPGDTERARKAFERAVELDPGNASAWVGLSPIYLHFTEPPEFEKARDATEKALALEPDNPEAHIRMSKIQWAAGNSGKGIEEMHRALETGPNNPLVLSIYSTHLDIIGDLDGAISALEQAVTVDPMHGLNLEVLSHRLMAAGRLDEAETIIQRALVIAPEHSTVIGALSKLRLLQGRVQDSLDVLNAMPEGHEKLFRLIFSYFSAGEIEASNMALAQYSDLFNHEESFSVDMASIHAWRDEPDDAFEWLNRSLDEFPGATIKWLFNPFLRSLHADPRWNIILERRSELLSNWDEKIRKK